MTDAKETDDRKRAAALVDELEQFRIRHTRDGVSGGEDGLLMMGDVALANEGGLWMAQVYLRRAAEFIRAYAAGPAVSADLRETTAMAIWKFKDDQTNSGYSMSPVYEEERDCADAVLAAITAAGYAIVPREPNEQPAPKWLSNVIADIEEYRSLKAGWDGESAEAPSTHSMNEAVAFIRSLERGDIETSLHVDGTVIIDIGFTTLRFTNASLSFVTRAALAAGAGHEA